MTRGPRLGCAGLLIAAACLLPGCDRIESQSSGRSANEKGVAQTDEPAKWLVHDFGIVDEGDEVVHCFQIENEAGHEIEYSRFTVSCPCMTIVENSCAIPPGGQGKLTVKVKTGGLLGRSARHAILFSKDPKAPPIGLNVRGLVAGFKTVPHRLALGDIKAGSNRSQTFLVAAASIRGPEVLEAIVDHPAFVVTTEKVVSDVKGLEGEAEPFCRVKVACTGDKQTVGAFAQKVRLTTNSSKFPIIEVPIVGYIKGLVEFEPNRIFFGNVKAATRVVRSCKAKCDQFTDVDLEALRLKSDHDFVRGKLLRASGSDEQLVVLNVELDLPPATTAGIVKGNLVVTQSDGDFLFSIPYVAVAQ